MDSQDPIWFHLPSARTAGVVLMKDSLNFSLSQKDLYFCLNFGNTFLWVCNFRFTVIFSQHFNDVITFLWTCIISEKKCMILIFIPFYVICLFSTDSFKIFSLWLAFSNMIIISLDVIFFVFILRGICWAQICGFIVFNKFGKISAIIYSNIIFCLLPFSSF